MTEPQTFTEILVSVDGVEKVIKRIPIGTPESYYEEALVMAMHAANQSSPYGFRRIKEEPTPQPT